LGNIWQLRMGEVSYVMFSLVEIGHGRHVTTIYKEAEASKS